MVLNQRLFLQIKELLSQHQTEFIVKEHEPTPTSQDSARARGESIKIGAKALLMKVGGEFVLCVLPADKRINSKKLRPLLGKKIRFATEEELTGVTGCEKGAVPPFGSLLGVQMIVDEALFENEFIAFNAGSLTKSIKMKSADYKKVVNPEIKQLSQI